MESGPKRGVSQLEAHREVMNCIRGEVCWVYMFDSMSESPMRKKEKKNKELIKYD